MSEQQTHKATCETHGHIYGHTRTCVFCGTAKPVDSIPEKSQKPLLSSHESDAPTCALCGEPMPAGEEMFKYHGFSGPCPKSPTPAAEDEADEEAARPEGSEDSWAPPLRRPVPPATSKQQVPNLMEALKR